MAESVAPPDLKDETMSKRDAHDAFFAHKRNEHRGEYKPTCPECERLWERYLEASKAAA